MVHNIKALYTNITIHPSPLCMKQNIILHRMHAAVRTLLPPTSLNKSEKNRREPKGRAKRERVSSLCRSTATEHYHTAVVLFMFPK